MHHTATGDRVLSKALLLALSGYIFPHRLVLGQNKRSLGYAALDSSSSKYSDYAESISSEGVAEFSRLPRAQILTQRVDTPEV